MAWRFMEAGDLAQVVAIAEVVHPDHPEDRAVLAERRDLYPPGCLALEADGVGSALGGYALSHPWTFAAPPPLNGLVGALPVAPDTYYIHDVALLPSVRGRGEAAVIVAGLVARARAEGLDNLSLVAIGDAHGFWARHGFRPHDLPGLNDQAKGYGEAAAFMVLRL